MSKLRSVNTHFWNDNFIIDLDPIEKLLFLYLLTNDATNMLGIYELNIRRIAFDTGIDKDMVRKIFERFQKAGKATYKDGYVILHNFTRHQSYNENMKKSAIASFNDLPESVRAETRAHGFGTRSIPFAKGLEPLPKGYHLNFPENNKNGDSDDYERVYHGLPTGSKPVAGGSEPIAELAREVEREKESEREGGKRTRTRAEGSLSFSAKSLAEQNSLTEYLDDARDVAVHLLTSIVHWDKHHKYAVNPPNIEAWAQDIAKAMKDDGRTKQSLIDMFDYLFTQDTETAAFWAANIYSGAQAAKHFDIIRQQATAEQRKKKSNRAPDKNELARRAEENRAFIDEMYEAENE